MTANELSILLFRRWNGDDVEIPPNLDDLCSEMLRQQEAELNEAGHMIGVLRWEIEQLKALVISLSPNANLIYTRSEE
jgi:hypothetical protein